MSKKLKIILVLIFAFILCAIFQKCEANSINEISMDILVDNNGTASVTEVWDCNVSQGTEVYHPYYNLGNSTFSDLSVSDYGINYETLSSWNTSGTLSSKAYQCGIHTISNGIELCWGISQYGIHKYIVKYNISNFVSTLTDSQMIYWTLIPYNFSSSIGNVDIKIHTNSNIPNDIGVWGYGNYGGIANVHDGYIEMKSKGTLSTKEYMTILVQFPSGTFSKNNNILNNNFQYFLDLATKDSKKYTKSSSSSDSTNDFWFLMLFLASPILALILRSIIILVAPIKKPREIKINLGEEGNILPTDNIPYYRDIPCNKDIFRAYFIAYQYNLLKDKNDLFGAIILKWLKDSLIRIEKRECGEVVVREQLVIILNETNTDYITNNKELELFNMLKSASKDGILESREFEKWCDYSFNKVINWFNNILKEQRDILISEGLLFQQTINTSNPFSSSEYVATSELKQEAINLAGLKKFLLEYTLVPEKEPMEVKIFEEYLIFAQILGIAKEVAERFKHVYPEIISNSNFSSDSLAFLDSYISFWVSSAYSASDRFTNNLIEHDILHSINSNIHNNDYTAGGGGFSSGGGGGGSFGGGGGGGGFR